MRPVSVENLSQVFNSECGPSAISSSPRSYDIPRLVVRIVGILPEKFFLLSFLLKRAHAISHKKPFSVPSSGPGKITTKGYKYKS